MNTFQVVMLATGAIIATGGSALMIVRVMTTTGIRRVLHVVFCLMIIVGGLMWGYFNYVVDKDIEQARADCAAQPTLDAQGRCYERLLHELRR